MATKKNNSLVICKLPKAGLGNQLFSLLKGHIFAELNNLKILVTGFNHFKIGPYLRAEKSKRAYSQYFIFQKRNYLLFLKNIYLRLKKPNTIVNEPNLEAIEVINGYHHYIFSEIPHWSDSFAKIKNHRSLALNIFKKIINPKILDELNKKRFPVIGVHIRMGDFKKVPDGQDFKKEGGLRTPEKYFIDVIENIRRINGQILPVSIFTDGYVHELPDLFKMDGVSIIEGNRDIIDLLLLSKSQIIITSAGSSFSLWAGFLSESPIILHPDHIHKPIRISTSKSYYEGHLDENSLLLMQQIKSISEN